ncbi:MAG TPA: metal ABC transporter substrate-binding protein [Chitinispirillaceae bacterium]|nr:metal ABC transporter substrate-binding protein [Chitinispirillaceae bacterium]
MKNMKCIHVLLQITVLLFIINGCSNHKKNAATRQVITSFYPVEIIVLNITRDIPGIDVSMLTPPGTGCLHDYQLTPVDMGKIEKADCMVINGAGMEPFLEKIIHEKSNLTLIDASVKCDLLHNEDEPGHHEEKEPDLHSEKKNHHGEKEHHHSDINPHVWLSPAQYLIQIQTVAQGLALCDSAHATLYLKNMDNYSQEIRQLQSELDTLLKNLPNRDIVTFHAAFSYFAKDYNLNVRAVIQQEPGQEPSASELANLIRIIKQYNIRSVFVEPQYRSKTADVLSRETGVHVDTLDPVVTGELTPDAYIKAMRKNGTILCNALKREVPANGN